MSKIDLVRLNVSDKSNMQRDNFNGDGVKTDFRLSRQNVLAQPDVRVYVNNVLDGTWVLDYTSGIVSFSVAPVLGAVIEVDYFFGVYTDAEIQSFLDQSGGNTDYASARLLTSWAANAARLAMRESLSGGGGIGSVTRDTSVVARELREAANAFMKLYTETSQVDDPNYVQEGLTEVIWTDQMMERAIEQDITRNW